MKNKYNLIFGLCFIIMANIISAQNNNPNNQTMDTETINSFVAAFDDPDILICTVELPDFGQELIALKSGQVVEEDIDYASVMLSCKLTKLNVIAGIKGDFDNIIFVEVPLPTLKLSGDNEPPSFCPYSGSKWTLLLKNGIDENRGEVNEWSEKVQAQNKAYFNRNTLFSLYNENSSAVCFKWNEKFDMPLFVQMTSENFASELKDIYQTMDGDRENREQQKNNLSKKIASLKNPYAISIAKEVINKID